MSLSKQANFDQAQSVVPCDVCEAESGEHYCTVCRQTLCDGCKKYHKKVAATKDHEVVPRVQMASAVASTTCSRHPDQTVSLQCKRCQVLVCINCVTGEHQGHPMENLSEIYEGEKDKMEKEIREIETKAIPDLTKAIKEIPPKREEYKKAIAGIRQEMDDEIKELKARLDKVHNDRLKKLAEAENAGLTLIDRLQQGLEKQKQSYIDDVTTMKSKLATKNQVQIITYARKRNEGKLPRIEPFLIFPGTPRLQKMILGITDMSELLGKLDISSSTAYDRQTKMLEKPVIISSFKSELQGWTTLCLTDDGKAWICGYDSKELRMVDANGKILKTKKTKNRSFALAMTSSGDIIQSPNGSDSHIVMRLRADGTECPLLDVSPATSNGVTVTEDGDILVCAGDGQVMRCNGDGGNLRKLYDGKKIDAASHAIELADGNICISDNAQSALLVIDKNGTVVKQITTLLGVKDYRPLGLACDKLGNILSVDQINHCVYIIDQQEEARGVGGEVTWDTTNHDGWLWIAMATCGLHRGTEISKLSNIWHR